MDKQFFKLGIHVTREIKLKQSIMIIVLNRDMARNPQNFRITDIADSFGFHGKIFLAARFLASTVILFFFILCFRDSNDEGKRFL